MGVPHPIPYQGSKRNLASQILRFVPDKTQRLVEPFAGSAAVSLAALYDKKVSHVLIGDVDPALIALWKAIVDTPDSTSDAYNALWHQQLGQERAYYDFIRAEFNKTHRPDFFLYLLARCVKAAVRYNANGEFNQSPDNRRKGTRPETMGKHILGASALLRNRCTLQHGDYRLLLEQTTSQDLIYLDPPYQGVCKNRDPRYREKIAFENFVEALDNLNSRGLSYIVSYDGRTGDKKYGEYLPESLNLKHIELDAGRSTQATLLGRNETTFESLYLSPALNAILEKPQVSLNTEVPIQLALIETLV